MSIILKARPVYQNIIEDVTREASALLESGAELLLVTVLVGDNDASSMYVQMKHRESLDIGIPTRDIRLAASITQEELVVSLKKLSDDPTVTSVLLQYPLPSHLNYFDALSHINPAKDVDGLHPMNLGRLTAGDSGGVLPCTPVGIVKLLEHYQIPFQAHNIVVVGRGNTVGRPLSILLSTAGFGYNSTVTLCHSRSGDLARHVVGADIVVAAAGAPGLITADMVRSDQVIVAAGVAFIDAKAVSDMAPDVRGSVRAITPTVGGVGLMTRACLFSNVILNAQSQTVH